MKILGPVHAFVHKWKGARVDAREMIISRISERTDVMVAGIDKMAVQYRKKVNEPFMIHWELPSPVS